MTNTPTPAPQAEMWTITEEIEGVTNPWVGIHPTLEAAVAKANEHLQETYEDCDSDASWVVQSEQHRMGWGNKTTGERVVVYRDSDQMYYFYFTQHITKGEQPSCINDT